MIRREFEHSSGPEITAREALGQLGDRKIEHLKSDTEFIRNGSLELVEDAESLSKLAFKYPQAGIGFVFGDLYASFNIDLKFRDNPQDQNILRDLARKYPAYPQGSSIGGRSHISTLFEKAFDTIHLLRLLEESKLRNS